MIPNHPSGIVRPMLFALALAVQAVPVPMVEHDHFYVTVDRPTFEAIRQSKWLREEFANVTVSTHASGDDQWTGIYVSGVSTYVEIFSEGADVRLGQAGSISATSTLDGVLTLLAQASYTRFNRWQSFQKCAMNLLGGEL